MYRLLLSPLPSMLAIPFAATRPRSGTSLDRAVTDGRARRQFHLLEPGTRNRAVTERGPPNPEPFQPRKEPPHKAKWGSGARGSEERAWCRSRAGSTRLETHRLSVTYSRRESGMQGSRTAGAGAVREIGRSGGLGPRPGRQRRQVVQHPLDEGPCPSMRASAAPTAAVGHELAGSPRAASIR